MDGFGLQGFTQKAFPTGVFARNHPHAIEWARLYQNRAGTIQVEQLGF